MLEGRAFFNGQELTMELSKIAGSLALDVPERDLTGLQQAVERRLIPTKLGNMLLSLFDLGVIIRCQIQGNRVKLFFCSTRPDRSYIKPADRLKQLSSVFEISSGKAMTVDWSYHTRMECVDEQSGDTVSTLGIAYHFLALVGEQPKTMVWQSL